MTETAHSSEDDETEGLPEVLRRQVASRATYVSPADAFTQCCGNPLSCTPAKGECSERAAFMAQLKETDPNARFRESVRYALAGPGRWALPPGFTVSD
jgi:hypothetical protein